MIARKYVPCTILFLLMTIQSLAVAQETTTRKFYCGVVRDGSIQLNLSFWYDSEEREITELITKECSLNPFTMLTWRLDETIDVSKKTREFSYSDKMYTLLAGRIDSDMVVRGRIEIRSWGHLGSSFTLASQQPLEWFAVPAPFSEYSKECIIEKNDTRLLSLAIGHANPDVRLNAIHALIENGRDSSTNLLKGALLSTFDDVRWNAALALGYCKDTSSAPLLIKLLDDGNPTVQWTAAMSLGFLGASDAVPPLLKLTGAKNSSVRWFSIEALSNFHDQRDSAFFHKALAEKDSTILLAGRKYFILMGTDEALKALIELLDSQNKPWFASDLLASKHPILVDAVKKWAEKHGYSVRAN